ncbi:hypothetical protein [Thalassoroseus pseudoceratinae]|uniref:hypothetical protein n=1 Tax=Thalassoroseus pseudoceratinae TaxID=2713176 RepID=UPI00141E6227|nr:hypothetical protein [Thalassoroseus pseudoceratinae]
MGAVTLLAKAMRVGLTVGVEGERLVVQGPKSAEAVAIELLDNKPAIVELLTPDVEEDLAERIAIMVVDGGLSPDEAERLARRDFFND